MRISLISPKWDQMVITYPPLGLAYLAAALQREGHDVKIHVFSLNPRSTMEEDVAEVVRFSPDVVGITSMTNVHYSAENLAEEVKRAIGCPIVMGGPHSTVMPRRTLENPAVDYVVVGEGENTLVELLRALELRLPLENIQGLYFKRAGQVVVNEPRPLTHDLDELAFPARHLLQLERFPLRAHNGAMMATVMTSRGCPYDCSYCFKGLYGRRYRQRTVENVLSEMKQIGDDFGIANFYFIDDLFTASRKWLTQFAQAVLDAQMDVRWQCLARVDSVSPEVLDLMYRAGCRELHYGIESGNQQILDRVSKNISLEKVRQAISWTKQAGMIAKGYFMVGLPGDTEQTIRDTIEYSLSLELDDAMFSITTPFPGTRLWNDLVAKRPNLEFTRDFSSAFYFTMNTGRPKPFLNVSEVSDEKLAELAAEAVSRFKDNVYKRRLGATYGNRLGALVWHLSRFRLARALGRRLARLFVFNRLIRKQSELAGLWT